MIKAGLDIGNSKISCVIADYKNAENINILSISSVPNNNIKKNIILNFENLHDQVKSLVNEAEKQSQTKLNSINLNLSLLNSNSYYYDSEIELKNERISELHLKKIINQDVKLNVVEVKQPDLDAQLVADSVTQQLEKRIMFRKAMKRAVQNTMRQGAKGIRIEVSGRLNGAEIARSEWYREGRVPLHTLKADIDYATSEALTTYGILGVKVWIYRGDKGATT